jgi:hypothetical protein
MARTIEIAIKLLDLPEFEELFDAAYLAVQVTPRSPSIDRLQEAIAALMPAVESMRGKNAQIP